MRYMVQGEKGKDDVEKEEDAGVIHLVHGWIQQGQKGKVGQKIIAI